TSNSGEMQLPRGLLTEYSNAISLTYGAWQNSINAYKAAFPSNAIALNLANPYSSKDGLLQSVSSYAESALGTRAALQNNSLKSTTSLKFAPVALMQSYASHGGRVGFQSIYDTKMTSSQFAAAMQIGKTVGASYYEVYKFQLPYLSSVAAANVNLAVVPEPSGIALAVTGVLALVLWVRRGAIRRK